MVKTTRIYLSVKLIVDPYKSMDVRAAILRFNRNWNNINTIIRFSCFEKMELLEIRKTLEL
jgi:hypothetical protein